MCAITGATAGVGYSTAHRLARGGADLLLVCRNLSAMQRVREQLASSYGIRVDTVQADLARLEEVRGAAAVIHERHLTLDVLINNAGVHCTKRSLTCDGNETAFAVNHRASFLLTTLLLPLLRARAPSRIIQVNSEGHRFGGLDVDDVSWSRHHGISDRTVVVQPLRRPDRLYHCLTVAIQVVASSNHDSHGADDTDHASDRPAPLVAPMRPLGSTASP